MNKLVFGLLILAILPWTVRSQNSVSIPMGEEETAMILVENAELSFSFRLTLQEVELLRVETPEGPFSKILVPGFTPWLDNFGKAELPVISRLIEVPEGATPLVSLTSSVSEIISLGQVAPAPRIFPVQPSLSKSDDPATVPFMMDKPFYFGSQWYKPEAVHIEFLGEIRGRRIAKLVVSPFSYNPGTGTLSVLKEVNATVTFTNGNMALSNSLKSGLFSPVIEASCENDLFNYKPTPNKDLLSQYPIKYVIVSDPAFQAALQPFVEWKIKKGFKVVQAYTNNAAVGTTTTSIKAYLQGLFNAATAADPAPTYLLLVGDVAQIPAFPGVAATHSTDLYYSTFGGATDNLPDLYYGRFSATSLAQLQPQIDKTLEYEKYLFPEPSFLNHVVMIGGVDSNFGPVYANGQINYGTTYYFNTAHGLTSHTYLYPASGSSDAAIIQDVSNGCGFANYTAHGSVSGWADPSFSISDVAGLQNNHEYPLMVGNACVTNTFASDCFGEALLRASGKGAVGYIGASNNSYWSEDFYFAVGAKTPVTNPVYQATALGFYDRLFHENGLGISNWYVTQGQIVNAGNLAVSQGSSGSSILYYWEIYHLMGDPSLANYFSVPGTLQVQYAPLLPIGSTQLQVTTEANAYVALSLNGVLLDARLVPATGMVTLSFAPLSSVASLDLVVTKQNRQPFMGTVSVSTANQPYVVYLGSSISDPSGNNNGQADNGETLALNISLQNYGNQPANSVNATLTANNPLIQINQGQAAFGNIPASGTSNILNAFNVTVTGAIPDQTIVVFTLTITDNAGNQWLSSFPVTIQAPALQAGLLSISDPLGNNNGRLDPGETAVITINCLNSGHAVATATTGLLSCPSPYITLIQNSLTLGNINPNGQVQATITVTVSPQAPLGTGVYFTWQLTSGFYVASQTYLQKIGLIVETFETNNFSAFPWQQSTTPWTIANTGAWQGSYCAKSGVIGHSSTTSLFLNYNVGTNDSIFFRRKVSSEASYDFLIFYIDNVEKGSWSGTVDWGRVGYPVSPGAHTFKWTYSKDYSVVAGSDAAWVDYIELPVPFTPMTLVPPVVDDICQGEVITLNFLISGGTPPYSFLWSNGATSQTVTVSPIQTTSYLVTVTDAVGAVQTGSIQVVVQPAAVVNLTPQLYGLAGQGINLTAPAGFQTYAWSTGATTSAITIQSSGTYALTVSNPAGCMGSGFTQVTLVPSDFCWWCQTLITSSNHTILVPQEANVSIQGQGLQMGDILGVFYDQGGVQTLGGYLIWTGTTDAIAAWGTEAGLDNGFSDNESFTWKLFRPQTNTTYPLVATYSSSMPQAGNYVTNGMSGLAGLSELTFQTQVISLPNGWSLISTYINPTNPNVPAVFQPVFAALKIVKNGNGSVYWPAFNINTIGNMVIGQAYQVNVTSAQSLPISGTAVIPQATPLTIPVNWSFLGYLRQSPAPIATLLAPILPNIGIVKDGLGNVYWPLWGINSIGNMAPGKGYQIRLNSQATLTYPANSAPGLKALQSNSPASGFEQIKITGENMTLGLNFKDWATVNGGNPFEIKVWSSDGQLVGAALVDGPLVALPLWGDDELTPQKDGLTPGEPFSIFLEERVIQKSDLQWKQGNGLYTKDLIAIAEIGQSDPGSPIRGLTSFPNPARESVRLSFYLELKGPVSYRILNALGEVLVDYPGQDFPMGWNTLKLECGSWESGVYFVHMEAGSVSSVTRILVSQ